MKWSKYISSNYYAKLLYKIYNNQTINLLDVGAGNHAASRLKNRFPQIKYYGLDISKHYNNDQNDFDVMEDFYEMDLTKLQFETIPDNHFDCIILSHIIEHLYNGELVLEALFPKLKSGGHIYVEWPSKRSAFLPSMKGTLNFFDDDTHVRFYDTHLLANLFMRNNFQMLKMGTKRDYWMMALWPYNFLKQLLKGQLRAVLFWDFLGFASVVFAKKK